MMSSKRKVLCVFSEEQEAEVRPALEASRPSEMEIAWRNDAEAALQEVAALQPDLVVVGMELGPMEGLEFLALLMRAEPTSTRPVMVAPGPTDPFPPVVHRRDPSSGRSLAVELERGDLAHRIVEVAMEQAASPPPAFAGTAEQPVAGAPRPAAVPIVPTTAAPARPNRIPLLIGIVGGVAIVGAITVYLAVSHKKPSPQSQGSAPPSTSTRTTQPSKGLGSGASQAAALRKSAAAQPRPPDRPKPAAPAKRLPDEIVLPLGFDRGSSKPDISDATRLEQVVAMMKADAAAHVEIGGHTSNEGSGRFNHRLGMARARAAVKLLAGHGIDAARLRPKSYAGKSPVAGNNTEAGRAKNRRVTLRRLR